ncbi:sigma-70 family RNA polymerase sigma factor [Spirosoma pollinicola]|uniref:RNA polymerase sigma-70 factor n=1 Tax=Spirosoma pollinicola TaxID=2057025 RepID=A0A2K8YUN1_9BACT|nr:sigma-70 family RNA polymerase sigma factor [Spirosoma pollinicola]AUD01337.1 RNA polymerase sigma-70 factor [Spirosoma pollinicola]
MEYKTLPDAVLLIYLKQGDESAFQEIYVRYWRKLFTIARNKLPSTDSPEDMVQDLFVKLWEQRRNLLIENLGAYLHMSLKYAIINLFKARLVREKYVEHAQSFLPNEQSTEEQIALNDLMATIEHQLNDFPEKTRQIFRLNRLEYKSAKEISDQLGIPERTVEYHINLSLKLLRPLLQDYLVLAIVFYVC